MATLVAPPPSAFGLNVVVTGTIRTRSAPAAPTGRPGVALHPVPSSSAARSRVLVAEPDPQLRAAYAAALAADGHEVEAVASLVHARTARPTTFDCVILDRGSDPGGGDALALVDELYRTGGRTRIVLVSGRTSAAERVEGLTRGADDFLAKPVRLPELVTRVRRLTQCRVANAAPPIRIGRVVIDQDRRIACLDGVEVDLTPTQYELLVALACEPGCVVRSRALLERGWVDHRDLDPSVLRPHVTRLRKALRGSIEVRCVRGVGYVLEAVSATVAAGRALADASGQVASRDGTRAKTA